MASLAVIASESLRRAHASKTSSEGRLRRPPSLSSSSTAAREPRPDGGRPGGSVADAPSASFRAVLLEDGLAAGRGAAATGAESVRRCLTRPGGPALAGRPGVNEDASGRVFAVGEAVRGGRTRAAFLAASALAALLGRALVRTAGFRGGGGPIMAPADDRACKGTALALERLLGERRGFGRSGAP